MHKKIGSFQALKSIIFLASLLLISSGSWAATKFLIIAPGQSYDGSTVPSRSNPVTQVAGESFNLNVYCYDDATNLPIDSAGQATTISSDAGTDSFSPVTFSLPDTYASVARSLRSNVSSTLEPSGNGTVNLSLTGGGGINSDTTPIYVQRIDHFAFQFTAPVTAGTPFAVTIQAEDASNGLCDAFNSTTAVSVTILDADENGGDVSLGPVEFVNGKWMGWVTLYHATQYAHFSVSKPSSPSVTTQSPAFVVNAATFTQVLLMGPGQTLRSGVQSGGNGRTGGSTVVSPVQVAGVSFAMTVYACDAYWNTRTGSGTVQITSEDSSITGGGSQSLASGTATFGSVELHIVGDGSVSMTADHSDVTDNTDNTVPLSATSLDHFGFNNSFAAAYWAGSTGTAESISIQIAAYDQYGNTVTTVSGTTTMEVREGGTTPISFADESWTITPTFNSAAFSSGIYNGTLGIRKAAFNYRIRISNSGLGSDYDSTQFNVTVGSPFWHIVIMPGQTYTPGARPNGTTWGRNGTPNNVTAGTPVSVSIVATDIYGNKVFRDDTLDWDNNSHLNVTDASASSNPDPILVTSGAAYPQFTLTAATTSQDLTIPTAIPPAGLIAQSSGTFTVVNTTLDHFSVGAGATQTAGTQFTMTIIAEDQYNNPVQTHSSTVYVTCPPLDYFGPTESVIQINGGTSGYSSGSSTAYWQVPGGSFSAGSASLGTRIYRATTIAASAYLFVSDVQTDTPSSNSGNIGQSVNMTVNTNTYSTMFAIVPGLTYRPGADANGNTYFAGVGYTGTPLSQQQGIPLSVSIYATDLFWNHITSANDNFTTTTSPNTANIHNQTYSLLSGLNQLDVIFSADADYFMTITNPSPGVNTYVTPYTITSFSVDHFTIELQGGGGLPADWLAGVPVAVSIAAYEDAVTIATTFNGTAELRCSLDHSATLKTIRPTSVQFTAGVWHGNVTLFRADRFNGENNNFRVVLGSTENSTSTLHVYHNAPSKLLVIEDGGMARFNGLNPDVDPTGELSIQGQPSIQTAGSAISKIDFYLCDDYWNKVTDSAQDANGTLTVTCTDPFPAQIGASPFSGGTLNVTLTDGIYEANNSFYLYKVNGSTGQKIGAIMGGYTGYELGTQKNAVPVKHAAALNDISSPYNSSTRRFNFILDTTQPAFTGAGAAVAGVPFALTVAAVDAYGNTLDSINGGTAFGTFTSVNLSANTDITNKSIWPTKIGTLTATQWTEGIAYPWIFLYKKVTGAGQFITASYDFGAGPKTGTSEYADGTGTFRFNVDPAPYARVVAYTTGMSIPDDPGAGGTYVDTDGSLYPSTPPPESATVFNNFGSPSGQVAGIAPSVLSAYTCDIFGNIVKNPVVNVSLSTTDPFAVIPADQTVNATNGFASFTGLFRFHTQQTSTITFADSTVTTMTAGSTPDIVVDHGAYYGLQILAPGQVAIEGSGNSGATVAGLMNNAWYSGVTPADPDTALNAYSGSAGFSGVAFPVTVQAVDLFGNFLGSDAPNNRVQLTSDDINPAADPAQGEFTTPVTMSNGRALFTVDLRTEGPRKVIHTDMDNASAKDGDSPDNGQSVVRMVRSEDVIFSVLVNGVSALDNTPVYVDAAPNTFNVLVEIRYSGTGEIVASTETFLMEPVVNGANPTTLTSGTLDIVNGATSGGIANITNQTYNRAENFFIRVRNNNGTDDPDPGFSPEIRVRASTAASIRMWAGASTDYHLGTQGSFQIVANKSAQINAQLFDLNGNSVSGKAVTMAIIEPTSTASELTAPQSLTSDSLGRTYMTFNAGADNIAHVIRATSEGVTQDITMNVTVTEDGGVYPNPYNPLTGAPAHIDYKVEMDASVKVELYTLLGDLVWSKEYAAGETGAVNGQVNSALWYGKNNSGVTVANGGYICIVKVDDQEKYRFKLGVYKER